MRRYVLPGRKKCVASIIELYAVSSSGWLSERYTVWYTSTNLATFAGRYAQKAATNKVQGNRLTQRTNARYEWCSFIFLCERDKSGRHNYGSKWLGLPDFCIHQYYHIILFFKKKKLSHYTLMQGHFHCILINKIRCHELRTQNYGDAKD